MVDVDLAHYWVNIFYMKDEFKLPHGQLKDVC